VGFDTSLQELQFRNCDVPNPQPHQVTPLTW
jgi:hypothetical protein